MGLIDNLISEISSSSGGSSGTVTEEDLAAGLATKQNSDGDLTAIAALTGTGFPRRTGVDTWTLTTDSLLYFDEAESALLSARRTNSFIAISADLTANAALVPKGDGAFLAQIPDGTAVGGGQRGVYAVDLQMIRTTTSQIASGSYSVVMGQDNTASSSGAIALGLGNNASNSASVAMGQNNAASGGYSVAMGQNNTSSGTYSGAIGQNNTASGINSLAVGERANTFSRGGCFAHSSGLESVSGDSQQIRGVFRNRTLDATPVLLTSDSGTVASTTNTYILQNYQGCSAQIIVNAVRKGLEATESKAWIINLRAYRGINAATTTVSVINTVTDGGVGTENWAIAIEANTTVGGWQIVATGEAAKSIQWTAAATAVENIYT